jgi:hypothetical protein
MAHKLTPDVHSDRGLRLFQLSMSFPGRRSDIFRIMLKAAPVAISNEEQSDV